MTDPNNDILLKEDAETAKQIGRTLWWVEHRERLGKIGILLLVIFDVCLVLFVVWSLVDAFLISASSENRSVIESVSLNQEDLHSYTQARAAIPVDISDTHAFLSGENAYDFYAQLTNSNADWWAEFEYQFVFDGGATEVKNGFILPNSKKPVVDLGFKAAGSVGAPELQFRTFTWHRIDHHLIPDYTKWSQDRLGIEIQNPMISQDTAIDTHALFRTSFTAKNNTAFSFYNPTFYLVLKRGSSVLGVNKAQIQLLSSGQTQDVVVNWFGSIPPASQIEVIPDMNLFDPMLYKAQQGSSSIDTRTSSP